MALHLPLLSRCSTLCLREDTHLRFSPPSVCMLPLRPMNPYSKICSSRYKRIARCSDKKLRASKAVELVFGNRDDDDTESDDDDDDDDDGGDDDGPILMTEEEREEMRRKIHQMLDTNPEVHEETDPEQRKIKMKKLLQDYTLVVEEEDPDWPEDANGRGFNLDQFFNKITIKNVKKDDDEDYDSDEEVVWQDDNCIQPIRDIMEKEWEDTVFKDFNPLIILVHNRYRRPKENEKARSELEKAVQMFWESGLPSPRCVAIDASVEHNLVDALQVSVFPEILFTKAGKILHRDKEVRTAEEWSKIMAFFYYKAVRPPCLSKTAGQSEEKIPSLL